MDLTDLETFMAIARRGSISAAADELHTVQSNITNRLKVLEAQLGVALFTRHSRGVALTRAGTTLIGYVDRMKLLAAEATAAVRDDGTVLGALRIGSMESTAAVRLPAVIGRFHRAHPDVRIEVRTGPTAELLEHVLAHRLDGALVAGPVAHPELTGETVFREELVLVAAHNSEDVQRRLERGGLTAVVFRQGCAYRQHLESHFAARGWNPFRRLEFGTLEGVLRCVHADVGITLVPRSAAEGFRDRAGLRIEPIAPAGLHVDTLFVKRADMPVGATMRSFSRVLAQCAPEAEALDHTRLQATPPEPAQQHCAE